MVGAFVPVALKDPDSHAAGDEAALKVARLLRATADRTTGETPAAAFMVLADNNGSDPVRTQNAGRVTPDMGLTDGSGRYSRPGAELVARAVQSRPDCARSSITTAPATSRRRTRSPAC